MSLIYFLGAGFSQAFGFPTANELHRLTLETPVDPTMADRRSALGKLAPIWDMLRAYTGEELEQRPLEEIIGLLNSLLIQNTEGSESIDIFGHEVSRAYVVAARDELQERALRAIRRVQFKPSDYSPVGELIKIAYESGGGIITTNFDQAVERFAAELSIPVTHECQQDENALAISHLHGSSNWFWHYDGDSVVDSSGTELFRASDSTGREAIITYEKNPDHPFFDGHLLAVFFKKTKTEACVRMDALKSVEWHLMPQWELANSLLDNADTWLVVGYSFPESDAFLRLWWTARLFKYYRSHDCFPSIVVVDPAATDDSFRRKLVRAVTNQAKLIPSNLMEALSTGHLVDIIKSLNDLGAHEK